MRKFQTAAKRCAVLLALLSSALVGCAKSGGNILGADPGTESNAQVINLKPSSQVIVSGVMYEKCPAAGCWFMLRDRSGVIRVDTKAAGFTVTDVPVNTQLIVRGTVKQSGERILVATGIRF